MVLTSGGVNWGPNFFYGPSKAKQQPVRTAGTIQSTDSMGSASNASETKSSTKGFFSRVSRFFRAIFRFFC